MDKEDKLGKLLGLPPLPIAEKAEHEIIKFNEPQSDIEQAETDFERVRDSLFNVLDVTNNALGNLANLVELSQSPKAYEALAKMADTVRNTSRDILAIHEQKKSLKKDTIVQNQTINNNLTISSAEMLKIIKEKLESNGP